MKRITIATFFILVCLNFLYAGTKEDLISAKDRYSKGKYEEAIKIYESILNSGKEAPELYFNLGNCYYKTKQYANAIVNYERAKRLAPTDDDIQNNLALVNQIFVVDKITDLPTFFLTDWIKTIASKFSVDLWAYISVLCFVLFLFFVSAYFFTNTLWVKKYSFVLSIAFVFASGSCLFLAKQQKIILYEQNYAIIYNPTVNIKSSPDEKGTDLFVLHNGTKIQITGTEGEWCEIKISSGNKGWVKNSDLLEI